MSTYHADFKFSYIQKYMLVFVHVVTSLCSNMIVKSENILSIFLEVSPLAK